MYGLLTFSPDVYSPFPFSYLYNLVSDPWMIYNTPEHYWWLWILYLKVYSDLDGPDRLLQRVEELEAEAVLLRGPLNELAGVEQHRSNPLAVFVGFIDEQHAWFQHTPQLGPALQSATNLNHIQIKCQIFEGFTSSNWPIMQLLFSLGSFLLIMKNGLSEFQALFLLLLKHFACSAFKVAL